MKVSVNRRRVRRDARRGVAAAEAALLLPLVLLLLLGIWEVGRMVHITQIMSNAAREGARQASTGKRSYDQVRDTVVKYLKGAGITDHTGLVIQVKNLTTKDSGLGTHGKGVADYDPTKAVQLDRIEVTVSLPFDNVRWQTPRLLSTTGTQMQGQAIWPCMRDQDYPAAPTVPDGS
jgi:Flp pilus assembly protein TadG